MSYIGAGHNKKLTITQRIIETLTDLRTNINPDMMVK